MQESNDVAQKRSKAVTFWGVMFIMFGTFSILTMIKYPTPFSANKVLIVVQAVGSLAAGVFLLQLKDFARKLVLGLAVLSIGSTIILMPEQIKFIQTLEPTYKEQLSKGFEESRNKVKQQTKPEFQKEALDKIAKEEDAASKFLPLFLKFSVIFSVVCGFIFNIFLIIFFLRPKVKSQFSN